MSGSFKITPETTNLSVLAGDRTTLRFRVESQLDQAEQVEVRLQGPADAIGWGRILPTATWELAGRATAQLEVVFEVPGDAAAGDRELVLAVFAVANPDERFGLSEELNLKVAGVARLTASLDPQTLHLGGRDRSGATKLRVSNPGAVAVQATAKLTARPPAVADWVVSGASATTTVGAGADVEVSLAVKIPPPVAEGDYVLDVQLVDSAGLGVSSSTELLLKVGPRHKLPWTRSTRAGPAASGSRTIARSGWAGATTTSTPANAPAVGSTAPDPATIRTAVSGAWAPTGTASSPGST